MAKNAWRLIFVEGLLANYLGGKYAWTFRVHRPGSNDFSEGQIIEGHFKDGISLLLEVLEKPRVKPFRDITEAERTEWNHGEVISHKDMMEIMGQYNPEVVDDTMAVLIKLRLARIDGRPIAGFLPELP
ncbi:MAG: hypothetical protein Q8Q06_00065 [bacterium]|nr:hypothetical protein [bacterium]